MGESLSQTDVALERIRASIIDLTLAPSSRIDEPLLSSKFGLGRTPAREAMNRLAAEGFVSIIPNRGGMYVRGLDLQEMLEIVTAQQIVESLLGQLIDLDDRDLVPDLEEIQGRYADVVARREHVAITAINEEFHLRMHRAVGNDFVFEFARSTHRHLRRLNAQIYRLEAADPEITEYEFSANVHEHDQIIDAIRSRDRDRLRPLLVAHSRTAQARLLHVIERSGAPDLTIEVDRGGRAGSLADAATG